KTSSSPGRSSPASVAEAVFPSAKERSDATFSSWTPSGGARNKLTSPDSMAEETRSEAGAVGAPARAARKTIERRREIGFMGRNCHDNGENSSNTEVLAILQRSTLALPGADRCGRARSRSGVPRVSSESLPERGGE